MNTDDEPEHTASLWSPANQARMNNDMLGLAALGGLGTVVTVGAFIGLVSDQ